MKSVTILMATFNGSAFLEDQLNSIQQQDYKNWKLIISDDGSSDLIFIPHAVIMDNKSSTSVGSRRDAKRRTMS